MDGCQGEQENNRVKLLLRAVVVIATERVNLRARDCIMGRNNGKEQGRCSSKSKVFNEERVKRMG